MWLRGEPDLFFVPTPWTVTRLVERYPNARGQVHVTGIPVHPAFEEPRSAKTARKCLNLQEEPLTLLLTAGGIGAGPFQEVIALLSRLEQRVQVVVVCGRNAGLQERLKRYIAHLPPSQVVIHLKGQVTQEEMALLMHASDAVLGKPGGLTSSEAMVAHCPMLIYTPFMIPGQEEQNAEALLQGGAARIAKTLNDLESLIKEFLSSEALRASMRQATEPLSAPAAAEKIASKIAE
jgi:processive 1,2-diacylglycerol beta-glucosyltransferase